MRAVIQRVHEATVRTEEQIVSSIDNGLFVLLGISQDDTSSDVNYVSRKIAGLRVFEDQNKKMNLSVVDIQGSLLLVPQFTLYGDCRKGRRPSFSSAAKPEFAQKLYNEVLAQLKAYEIDVKPGAFQQHMDISTVNDGPVTLLIDSNRSF